MCSHVISASLVALSVAVLAACDRTQNVYEVRNQPVPRFAPPLNPKQVEGGIIRAARNQTWRLRRVKPGQLEATKRWRSHIAVVAINYSPDTYDIIFRRSQNLLEGDGRIHRRFNQFVFQLDEEISKQLSFNPSEIVDPTAVKAPEDTSYVRISPKIPKGDIPDGFLSAEQIKTSFMSRTYDTRLRSGMFRTIIFKKNGTLHGTPQGGYGGATVDFGTWSIDDGNRLCTRWDKWYYGKKECLRVQKRGKQMHLLGARSRVVRTLTLASRVETKSVAKSREVPDGEFTATQIRAFLPGITIALPHTVMCGEFDNLGGDSCHLLHEFRQSEVVHSTTIGHTGSSEEDGRWWIQKNNSLCLKWPSWFEGKQRCYRVVKSGKKITLRDSEQRSTVYLIEKN
jgi:hypothetical protein